MKLILFAVLSFLSFASYSQTWTVVESKNNLTARHESAFVECDGKFYALGGRGTRPVEEFDPGTSTWTVVADAPMEFHHFQAIAFNHEIWVVAAMTGNYPHETPIPNMLIFNPKSRQWREGARIPADRLRGSAGIFSRGNSIYIVSGIKDGHWDGHVTWFDEYDTKKDSWRILPDAPHARDHVQAALVNDQVYLAGGRRSHAAIGKVLDFTVKEVDYYDFKTNKWSTTASGLPTPRAGTASVGVGHYLVVMNGESVVQKNAHAEVEALDTRTGTWTTLTPMKRGRHGTGVVYLDGKLWVAAGNETRGGGAELNDMEVLTWKPE